MTYLFSIDPSLRASGWAIFSDGKLHSAGLIRTKPTDLAMSLQEINDHLSAIIETMHGDLVAGAAEFPQVYYGGSKKNDANDLLPLAAVVGMVAASMPTTLYKPREWKGTLEKSAMNARVKARLTPNEVLTLETCYKAEGIPPSLQHNVLDAVGVGLHHLGRLSTKKVYGGIDE